jgi:hypothetical protein
MLERVLQGRESLKMIVFIGEVLGLLQKSQVKGKMTQKLLLFSLSSILLLFL